jgi:hypothetical protein
VGQFCIHWEFTHSARYLDLTTSSADLPFEAAPYSDFWVLSLVYSRASEFSPNLAHRLDPLFSRLGTESTVHSCPYQRLPRLSWLHCSFIRSISTSKSRALFSFLPKRPHPIRISNHLAVLSTVSNDGGTPPIHSFRHFITADENYCNLLGYSSDEQASITEHIV